MPKISIIIPVYNAENYLEECLLTISQQTFTDFEILAINDGSTDRSLEILKQYQENEPRLKIFSQVNKGVSAARNLGLDNAKGEYIAFVDADDFLLDVEWLYQLIHNVNFTNSDIVCAGFTCVRGQEKISVVPVPFPKKTYNKKEIVDKMLPFFFQKDTFNAIFTKLYSRKLIHQNNVFFPNHLKIAEDTYFNLKCFSVANTVSIIENYGYAYREVMGSATKNVLKNDYLDSTLKVYEFNPEEITNHQVNLNQVVHYKKEKLVNSILSLMYIYIKPKNGLSICEKWQKVSKIVHHKTVNQVFNQYNLIAKNKFEKYSFDAIKKKQVFKLFLYNYYSCLRNKN